MDDIQKITDKLVNARYLEANKITDILSLVRSYPASSNDIIRAIINDTAWSRFIKSSGDIHQITKNFNSHKDELTAKIIQDSGLLKQCISTVTDLIIIAGVMGKKRKDFANIIEKGEILDNVEITEIDLELLRENFPELDLTKLEVSSPGMKNH